MASSTPRRIHIPSAGYLRRFAEDSHLMVHEVATRERRRRGVRAVGWRADWWSTEPGLSEAVEESLNQCESPALRALRRLDQDWPLSGQGRALLGQFIAIHIVRTPGFKVFLEQTTEDAIDDERQRRRVDPEHFDAVAEYFRGPRTHANALLGQISRIASLFCDMQWTLVRVAEDLLVTSDQPVVVIPFVAPGRQPNTAVMPSSGLMNTIEVRFPLDPRSLLLMTWAMADDAVVEGTFNQACNVNCSVSAQADREWFFRPGTVPHRLAPPVLRPTVFPIAPQLLSGYDLDRAVNSSRRHEADHLMTKMIKDNAPRTEMRWVTAA